MLHTLKLNQGRKNMYEKILSTIELPKDVRNHLELMASFESTVINKTPDARFRYKKASDKPGNIKKLYEILADNAEAFGSIEALENLISNKAINDETRQMLIEMKQEQEKNLDKKLGELWNKQ